MGEGGQPGAAPQFWGVPDILQGQAWQTMTTAQIELERLVKTFGSE